MRRMYLRDGTPIRDIAKFFGVTAAGVYENLKRQGIEPNRKQRKRNPGNQPIAKGKKMWIRRLHMRGMSQREIAEQLELSRPTVQKYLREYGLIGEPKQREPKAPVDKQGGMMTAQIVYVSRPWWRRVIDWFRG